ncbi:hypothetical protein NKH33_07750 [Mesorhizobium sp. M1182]|uniref:hypothetical protein n=1 Tax=Mesorhizobium sp. M1182 TaxID=2957067 RepID=UPI003339FCD2
MAFSLGKSTMLAAAMFASAAAAALHPMPAFMPQFPAPVGQPVSRKKRKPAKKRTPVRWGAGSAKTFMSRRSRPAGCSSTLKKTAKLLRLQAGGR